MRMFTLDLVLTTTILSAYERDAGRLYESGYRKRVKRKERY